MVTFEGAEHLSILEPICSPSLEDLIETTCNDIAKHIQTVSGNNIQIARMTLYFRCDNKMHLWLSFVSRMKVRDNAELKGSIVQDCLSPRLIAVPIGKSLDPLFLKNFMKQNTVLFLNKANCDKECCFCSDFREDEFPVKLRYILHFMLSGTWEIK
jgi:hypothetical protein